VSPISPASRCTFPPPFTLAELEARAEIYPYIGVMEYVSRLRAAYAEIDRLNRVIVEWQRDMQGTLAPLEVERWKNANKSCV
jgi:hypothetical protein